MKRESWTVSDLHLEQYVLGELTARDMKKVSDALREDESLRARLAGIEGSNAEILAEYPPQRMAPLLEARASEEASRAPVRKARPFTVIVLPAAAMVLLFLSIFTPVYLSRGRTDGTEITRAKGSELQIYKKTAEGAEKLGEGSVVAAGDVLQIGYMAGEARYGVVFSVDGRGVVTFHLPESFNGQAQNAPSLDLQGWTVLPFSYELDNAPVFERFFFVFSSSRFDVREVANAAKNLASNLSRAQTAAFKPPRGLNVLSLLLKKQG
jgi:hypothetical protein